MGCKSVFVCLFSDGSAVRWPLRRVQQDPAGVFPVGVEERRRGPAGALGVGSVRPSDQPLAWSSAPLSVLFRIQGTSNSWIAVFFSTVRYFYFFRSVLRGRKPCSGSTVWPLRNLRTWRPVWRRPYWAPSEQDRRWSDAVEVQLMLGVRACVVMLHRWTSFLCPCDPQSAVLTEDKRTSAGERTSPTGDRMQTEWTSTSFHCFSHLL